MREVFVLDRQVVHRGKDFFGRKAWIQLKPRFRGGPNTWSWKASYTTGGTHEIRPEIVRTRGHRTELTDGKRNLSVFEHVGPLRFFPLVGDLEITATSWPPYDGRAIGLWSAVKPACRVEAVDVPLYTVAKPVWHEYKKMRGGQKAFTQILPADSDELVLDITRSFSGIGTYQKTFHFPNSRLLEEVCMAKTLGNPDWLYYLSSALSAVSNWPHHKSVLWPQENETADLLRGIVWHAALDTLGSLNLLCRDGYFIGRVTSVCSGHEGDTGAVMKANQCLVRV